MRELIIRNEVSTPENL